MFRELKKVPVGMSRDLNIFPKKRTPVLSGLKLSGQVVKQFGYSPEGSDSCFGQFRWLRQTLRTAASDSSESSVRQLQLFRLTSQAVRAGHLKLLNGNAYIFDP